MEDSALSYDEAVNMLPDGENIHTFVQAGSMLIGADWRRESILNLLAESRFLGLSGPAATEMGHGLAVIQGDGGPLFIETKTEGG